MSKEVMDPGSGGRPAPRRALAEARLVPQELLDRQSYYKGDFWLGRSLNGRPVGWSEDTNLLTCAGTGAGKGVSSVIPNLLTFPGSAVVIDPKGELATLTAEYRSKVLGQKVIVLDPARTATVPEKLRGTYNPFEALDPGDRFVATGAQAIASGILVPNPKATDPYWDQTAFDLVQSCILYMLSRYPREQQTLMKLRETLALGDQAAFEAYVAARRQDDPSFKPDLGDHFEHFLLSMNEVTEFGGIVRETAIKIAEAPDTTRGSILSTARSHMDFLKSAELWDVLQPTTDPQRSFRLPELRRQDRPLTVYMCLPVDMIKRQGQWFRIILSQVTQYLERTANNFEKDKHDPVLLLMDEFFQLGHIPSITNTLTYSRSSGLRVWIITQDLNQIKKNYPDEWETIVGACGIKQFFGVNDPMTAEYVSKLIGEQEIEVPSVSMARNTSDTEGVSTSRATTNGVTKTTGTNWSTGETLSSSTTLGYSTTDSQTTGTSNTNGLSSNLGHSYGTGFNFGHQANQNASGLQTDRTTGGSSNINYGYNAGTGTSSANTQSDSNTHSSTLSSSTTTGRSLSRTQGGSESTALSSSNTLTEGENSSKTKGETYTLTYSKQARRLLRPEDIMLSFTKHNLVQLTHIQGQGGMLLMRTPYFADPDLSRLLQRVSIDA